MLAVMYCCCFLDRSNVGNAKILGLTQDLKLDSHQWAVALAVFYVFYVLAEIPSSLLLKKITPRLWLALLGFICGLLGMCVAFVRNYAGFVAIRIILGLFEGGEWLDPSYEFTRLTISFPGLLPGIIIYFSGMYTRGELALRLGIFYVSASIAGAFSGLLARGLAEIPPRGIIDDGWRWILLIEGLLTMVVAVIVCVLLPNNIGDAWYLTPEEQEFGARRLHLDIAARLEREPLSEKLDWKEVRRAALSVRTWAMAVIIICVLSGIYSFSIFLPTIIKGLGYTANAAQLWSVIPYAVASVVTVVVSVLSDRLRLRGPFVMFTLTIGIIGYASIAYIDKQHVKAKYGMTMLMATGLYATTPPVLAWIANNAAGHYKRAASIGIMMAFGNCGGFIGCEYPPRRPGLATAD